MNVYDAEWYSALQDIVVRVKEVDWFGGFMRMSSAERLRFMQSEVENPQFVYRDEGERVLWEDPLEKLSARVIREESNEIVRTLYKAKITNQFTRIRMLRATIHSDDQAFFDASVQLYGKPKPEFFAYIAKRVTALCDDIDDKTGAAKRLRKLVAKIDTTTVDVDAGILPPYQDNSASITNVEEVIQELEQALVAYGLAGWRIVVDQSGRRRSFAVSSEDKVVKVPNKKQLLSRSRALTLQQVQALAEHEVGVHARRAYAGSHSRLRLLQSGLAGYLKGEEGLASYVQQQVEGADEFYGLDRYFAAGLAIGLDGGAPRDFRAIFTIMYDYYQLVLPPTKDRPERAMTAAWDVCVRIFRGTSGQTAGCIYTKDIVYFEGNIGIWHLLSDKPHIFDSLFVGKFNPLDEAQVTALQGLKILPEW
jgi:hypothetical protein